MFRIHYKDIFEESWHVLKGNLVLFLPNLFMLILSLFLGLFFFWISGFLGFFIEVIHLPDQIAYEKLLSFLQEGGIRFVGLFILYLFFLFSYDIFFSLAKFGMLKDVIAKKKSIFKDGLVFAVQHFQSSIHIHLFSLVLILLPLVILGIIFSKFFTSITLLVIFIVFTMMYKFLVIFRVLLPYPVMAFERKGGFKEIRTDFHYLKTQLGHFFISWILILGCTFLWALSISPDGALDRANFILVIGTMCALVIFEIVLSTWEQIFVIDAHLSKKRVKKRKRKR